MEMKLGCGLCELGGESVDTKLPDEPTNCTTTGVTIKKENDEVEEEDLADFVKKGGVSPSTSGMEVDEKDLVPKPLEKLHEIGPPPFLSKTFEMVEDPKSDDVVSWGESGASFVVWDPHKFSTDLIPNYFKHSNFSSFIRQLNTYGFRKVHFERWEFANAGFQRGKKYLLKTIKRRIHGPNNNATLQLQRETVIDNFKDEQEAMKVEIHDLQRQQQNSDKRLAAMEERVKAAEWKQKEFILLIAKAMKRTPVIQQLLQTYKQKRTLSSGESCKKRRLTSIESLEDSLLAKYTTQNADQCSKADVAAVPTEPISFPGSPHIDMDPSSMQVQKSDLTTKASSPELASGNYIMWEKLMEDDVICDGDEEEAVVTDQTNFIHELEDLIAKSATCGSFANVGEVAC